MSHEAFISKLSDDISSWLKQTIRMVHISNDSENNTLYSIGPEYTQFLQNRPLVQFYIGVYVTSAYFSVRVVENGIHNIIFYFDKIQIIFTERNDNYSFLICSEHEDIQLPENIKTVSQLYSYMVKKTFSMYNYFKHIPDLTCLQYLMDKIVNGKNREIVIEI